MPLTQGLLNPIPGDNPSGQDLRYDPVYDKIREARRAEEEVSFSEELSKNDVWTQAVKKADFIQVIKLSTEALSQKSKDLQIAAWLTEALLAQEKIAGLTQGLELLRGLVEGFWETLYPIIEDDDVGMRAAPLEWVGSNLEIQVRRAPLTKNNLDWFKFQESRLVPYEKDGKENEAKRAAREAAIAEKKCTPEDFDLGVKASGTGYYQQLSADLHAALEVLRSLESLTDEKFGREAPSFTHVRKALEDLQEVVGEYWRPQEEQAQETPSPEEHPETVGGEERTTSSSGAGHRPGSQLPDPADPEDALQRVTGLARFLRLAEPSSPVSYLLLRGLRWGELRASGSSLDANLLSAPTSDIRQQLKKLFGESNWTELLEASETAAAQACGRGWLDLQRYTVFACENLGYEAAAKAVRSELFALLSDFPDLISAFLSDDTPAANPETRSWITESVRPATPPAPDLPIQTMTALPVASGASGDKNGEGPDVLELAQQAALSGRVQEAVELLSREIARERSGRGRFQRKVQLAGLCLSVKREDVAFPILAELAEEIERRKLEEWEESSALARPLTLLFHCMGKLNADTTAKQRIYEKICRLDPVQILSGRV